LPDRHPVARFEEQRRAFPAPLVLERLVDLDDLVERELAALDEVERGRPSSPW
jgi:hypothetical protein